MPVTDQEEGPHRWLFYLEHQVHYPSSTIPILNITNNITTSQNVAIISLWAKFASKEARMKDQAQQTAWTQREAQKDLRCSRYFNAGTSTTTAADQTSAKQSAAVTTATNAHTC